MAWCVEESRVAIAEKVSQRVLTPAGGVLSLSMKLATEQRWFLRHKDVARHRGGLFPLDQVSWYVAESWFKSLRMFVAEF